MGYVGMMALQLAAGVEVDVRYLASGLPAVIFISADTELNVAAMAEGLTIDDPNTHP
jgi:uncharacterized protein